MEDILAIIIIFGVGALFDRMKKQDKKRTEAHEEEKISINQLESENKNLNSKAKKLESLKDELKEKRKEKYKTDINKEQNDEMKNETNDGIKTKEENIREISTTRDEKNTKKILKNDYYENNSLKKSKNISFINKNNIKNAIILKEILDKPKSLKK
ncbi:hypothetical protein WG909_12705 [Peptostreptococcaceae bacterium AGR-M142]